MLITAEDLDHWAESPEARRAFPELVRRLIAHAGAVLRRLDVPSGSGTDLAGFDGIVEVQEGTARIPDGRSVWELSCEKQVPRKARKDLAKRTRATGPEERAKTSFVFATPRKWSGKDRWLEEARGQGWKDVRAYDAHDLVQWLGIAPAVHGSRPLRPPVVPFDSGPTRRSGSSVSLETSAMGGSRWSKECLWCAT